MYLICLVLSFSLIYDDADLKKKSTFYDYIRTHPEMLKYSRCYVVRHHNNGQFTLFFDSDELARIYGGDRVYLLESEAKISVSYIARILNDKDCKYMIVQCISPNTKTYRLLPDDMELDIFKEYVY